MAKVKSKTKVKSKRTYTNQGQAKPLPVKNSRAKKAKTAWDNTTDFEILEDVPMPWTRITNKELIFPFQGMAIGQSFQFMREKEKGQPVYSASVSFCKQPEHFHKRFVVRKISESILRGVEMVTWGCWREDDLTNEDIERKKGIINEKHKQATLKRHQRARA